MSTDNVNDAKPPPCAVDVGDATFSGTGLSDFLAETLAAGAAFPAHLVIYHLEAWAEERLRLGQPAGSTPDHFGDFIYGTKYLCITHDLFPHLSDAALDLICALTCGDSGWDAYPFAAGVLSQRNLMHKNNIPLGPSLYAWFHECGYVTEARQREQWFPDHSRWCTSCIDGGLMHLLPVFTPIRSTT